MDMPLFSKQSSASVVCIACYMASSVMNNMQMLLQVCARYSCISDYRCPGASVDADGQLSIGLVHRYFLMDPFSTCWTIQQPYFLTPGMFTHCAK